MANKTYTELRNQIAALEVEAAKVKSAETAEVVAKIKVAIDAYDLTPQHLFGGKAPVAGTRAKGGARRSAKSAAADAPKYIDGKGGQWGGRGKRPRWLSDALAAGRQLEDFLAEKYKAAVETFTSLSPEVSTPVEQPALKKSAPKVAKKSEKTQPAAVGKKGASAAKYSDGVGSTWSGRGPQPKWLKEAIAGGKTLEDFLVKS